MRSRRARNLLAVLRRSARTQGRRSKSAHTRSQNPPRREAGNGPVPSHQRRGGRRRCPNQRRTRQRRPREREERQSRRAGIADSADTRKGRFPALAEAHPNPPNTYRSLSFVVVAPGAGVKLQRRGLRRRVYVEVAGFGVGLGEGILLIEEDLRYIVGQLLIHGLVDDEVVGDGDNGHGLL